ncbi:MAG: hypothetical protein PHF57_03295 [Methanoregula sp.]|nr:hypothetical protein [Methanoregula sp.]
MDNELRIAISRTGFQIRVTDERWAHITESHDYMAGYLDHVIETVENPDWLVKGWTDEVIAIKQYPVSPSGKKSLVVVYKDLNEGFVITAFITSKHEKILKRGIVWER